ncbi:hypothetical protein BJ165DRAFT_1532895 [Panaeolus papilionaceus]|nr:hypothetical protein BJ165DRAFT_1532895 [Panaeolus papilionaceus]
MSSSSLGCDSWRFFALWRTSLDQWDRASAYERVGFGPNDIHIGGFKPLREWILGAQADLQRYMADCNLRYISFKSTDIASSSHTDIWPARCQCCRFLCLGLGAWLQLALAPPAPNHVQSKTNNDEYDLICGGYDYLPEPACLKTMCDDKDEQPRAKREDKDQNGDRDNQSPTVSKRPYQSKVLPSSKIRSRGSSDCLIFPSALCAIRVRVPEVTNTEYPLRTCQHKINFCQLSYLPGAAPFMGHMVGASESGIPELQGVTATVIHGQETEGACTGDVEMRRHFGRRQYSVNKTNTGPPDITGELASLELRESNRGVL